MKLKKCCKDGEMLNLAMKCKDDDFDDNDEKFMAKITSNVYDLGERMFVRDRIEFETEVVDTRCARGKAELMRVLVVLINGSLVIEGERGIGQKLKTGYKCIDFLNIMDNDVENDLVALECKEETEVNGGIMKICCAQGQGVDRQSLKCVKKEMETHSFRTIVLSKWTRLPTNLYTIKTVDFTKLCESGRAFVQPILGITGDSFAFNSSTGEEWEYGCVEKQDGKLMAWTCEGKKMSCFKFVITIFCRKNFMSHFKLHRKMLQRK